MLKFWPKCNLLAKKRLFIYRKTYIVKNKQISCVRIRGNIF